MRSECPQIFWFALQMITCSLQEDGYELCLNLTFALRNKKDPFKGSHVGIATHQCSLSQHIEQESLAFGSDDEISMVFCLTSEIIYHMHRMIVCVIMLMAICCFHCLCFRMTFWISIY